MGVLPAGKNSATLSQTKSSIASCSTVSSMVSMEVGDALAVISALASRKAAIKLG